MTRWVLVAAVAGCACPPTAEVRGGTAEQVASIEGALAAFTAWIAPESVCVPHVRVAEMGPFGRYNTVTRGVRVNHWLTDDFLAEVVTHELCHAYDTQLGVLDGDEEVFVYSAVPDEDWSERRTHREALAEVCQRGEEALALLASLSCGEDLDAVDVVLADIYGEVAAAPVGGWVQTHRFDLVSELGDAATVQVVVRDDGVMNVYITHGDTLTVTSVDPVTGEPAQPSPDSGTSGVPDDVPVPPTLHLWDAVEVPGEPGAWVADVSALLPDAFVRRLIAGDADGWRTLDVCVPYGADLVAVGDQVLLVTVEGQEIVWGPVLVE